MLLTLKGLYLLQIQNYIYITLKNLLASYHLASNKDRNVKWVELGVTKYYFWNNGWLNIGLRFNALAMFQKILIKIRKI